MELKDYVDKIKFQLTGGVIESEIPDKSYEKIVNDTVREINNYYNVTALLQLDASQCIDLKDHPEINNVIGVHRLSFTRDNDGIADPTYISYLQMYNIGSTYFNPQQLIYNIGNYNLAQQISNTMSTDLSFRYDEHSKKLYVNYSEGIPEQIVIEYVPRLLDASQVLTEYWQDVLYRLALADAKVILGRIRTRYRPTSALYEDDGEAILAEGRDEGTALRERLKAQADMVLPLD